MSDDLTSPLWGTGYGSKRHAANRTHVEAALAARTPPRSWCGRLLVWFEDAPPARWLGPGASEAEYVASRPPSSRCLKIAEKEATT